MTNIHEEQHHAHKFHVNGSTTGFVTLRHRHSHLAKTAELYRGVLFDIVWIAGVIADVVFLSQANLAINYEGSADGDFLIALMEGMHLVSDGEKQD